MLKTPCKSLTCGDHAAPNCKGYCVKCSKLVLRAQWRAFESKKDKESNRFYASARWRAVRLAFLREHPICQACNDRAAGECHHIVKRVECDDPFDFANLKALCRACHLRLTLAGE